MSRVGIDVFRPNQTDQATPIWLSPFTPAPDAYDPPPITDTTAEFRVHLNSGDILT